MALDYKIYYDYGKQYNRLKLMDALVLDSASMTITTSPTTSTDDTFEFLTRNTSTGLLEKLAEPIPLSAGGTGADLVDPGADRIFFWDDSAGQSTWLELGSGLSITGTTISATAGLSEPTGQVVFGTGTGVDSEADFFFSSASNSLIINQPGVGTGANILLTKPAAVGAYNFLEMQYGGVGDGSITVGNGSGTGFAPMVYMKPDVDLQNFSFIISETGDTGASAAIILDGRTSSGALATQGVLSIGSSNTAYLTVKADKTLRLHDYGSTGHTGTVTKMLGVDASGNVIQENAYTDELAQDAVFNNLSATNGLTGSYNDGAGTYSVVLGGTLTGDTSIDTGATHTLTITGSDNYIFKGVNTGSGNGVYGESATGVGVIGYSGGSSGIGVQAFGTGANSSAVLATNDSGTGITVSSTTGLPAYIYASPASTNTSVEIMRLARNTSGTAAANIGAHIAMYVENGAGNTPEATKISSVFTDVTNTAEKSVIDFHTRNGVNFTNRVFRILPGGNIQGTAVIAVGNTTFTASTPRMVSYNGAGAATFTLPPVSGFTGVEFYVKNKSAADSVTVVPTNASEIFSTSAVSTFEITAGDGQIFYNDGSHWCVMI